MGSKLVAAALANALPTIPPSNHAARSILVTMAHTAMDGDADPTYWRGSDHLAISLGYESKSPAGHRAVERALAYLLERGFIDQIRGTERRRARRWLMTYERSTPSARRPRDLEADPGIDGAPADTDGDWTEGEESSQEPKLLARSVEPWSPTPRATPAVTPESQLRARAAAREQARASLQEARR